MVAFVVQKRVPGVAPHFNCAEQMLSLRLCNSVHPDQCGFPSFTCRRTCYRGESLLCCRMVAFVVQKRVPGVAPHFNCAEQMLSLRLCNSVHPDQCGFPSSPPVINRVHVCAVADLVRELLLLLPATHKLGSGAVAVLPFQIRPIMIFSGWILEDSTLS
jgi:hypothetical protein